MFGELFLSSQAKYTLIIVAYPWIMGPLDRERCGKFGTVKLPDGS